jgi:hypothetical protein
MHNDSIARKEGPQRRSGLRTGLAAVMSVAMIGLFGAIAAPSSAEEVDGAEKGGPAKVSGEFQCRQVGGVNDGTWDITWTVENMSNDLEGTIEVDTAGVTPTTAALAPQGKVNFSQNVASAKEYEFEGTVTWTPKESMEDDKGAGTPPPQKLKAKVNIDTACPTSQISLTCAAGLTVNLAGYAIREARDSMDGNRVMITVDGIEVIDVPFDNGYTYPGVALNPAIAHTARVVVESWIKDADIDRTLELAVCNPTIVPGPGTTTTVTVPGPTVSATATVTATPSPAVAPSETATPVVTPEPAVTAEPVVITPEPATAPTVVNAGDGSSAPQSGLPLWAMALAAVAAIGAAGASVRLATKKH